MSVVRNDSPDPMFALQRNRELMKEREAQQAAEDQKRHDKDRAAAAIAKAKREAERGPYQRKVKKCGADGCERLAFLQQLCPRCKKAGKTVAAAKDGAGQTTDATVKTVAEDGMFIKAEPVDHDAQISLPLTQETTPPLSSESGHASDAEDGTIIKQEPLGDDNSTVPNNAPNTMAPFVIPEIPGLEIHNGTRKSGVQWAWAVIDGHLYVGGILTDVEYKVIKDFAIVKDKDNLITAFPKFNRISVPKFVEHMQQMMAVKARFEQDGKDRDSVDQLREKAKRIDMDIAKLATGTLWGTIVLNGVVHTGGNLNEAQKKIAVRAARDAAGRGVTGQLHHQMCVSHFLEKMSNEIMAQKKAEINRIDAQQRLEAKMQALGISKGMVANGVGNAGINYIKYAACIVGDTIHVCGNLDGYQVCEVKNRINRQAPRIIANHKHHAGLTHVDFVQKIQELIADEKAGRSKHKVAPKPATAVKKRKAVEEPLEAGMEIDQEALKKAMDEEEETREFRQSITKYRRI